MCDNTSVEMDSNILMHLSACLTCLADSPSLPHDLPDFSVSVALCTKQSEICILLSL